jgi:hypothetical protein
MANKLLFDLDVYERRDNNLCLGNRSVDLQITLESILSQKIVGSLVANIGTEVIWQSMSCAFLRIDINVGRFGVQSVKSRHISDTPAVSQADEVVKLCQHELDRALESFRWFNANCARRQELASGGWLSVGEAVFQQFRVEPSNTSSLVAEL